MFDGEKAAQLDALERRISALESLDVAKQVRADLEPQVNFMEFQTDFETLRDLGRRLHAFDFKALPASVAADAVAAFDRLLGPLGQVQTFSVLKVAETGRNVPDARNALAATLRASYQQFLRDIAPLLAYTAALPSEEFVARTRADMLAVAGELHSTAKEAREALEGLRRLESLAKETVQKVGIAGHAVHFESEAKKHEADARLWLGATVALAAGVGVLSVLNLGSAYWWPLPTDAVEASTIVVAKLLVFSTFVTATLWCARVYRSHKHNAVVNRHRQNALSSFETFAASTSRTDVRDIVLVQATQSIFAPQHSGFSNTDSDPSSSASAIELLRAAGGQSAG